VCKPIEHTNNRIHHTIDIRDHIRILESKNLKSLTLEIELSARIAFNLVFRAMRCTIDFYNQSMGQAGKIRDEMINWYLPAELLS